MWYGVELRRGEKKDVEVEDGCSSRETWFTPDWEASYGISGIKFGAMQADKYSGV